MTSKPKKINFLDTTYLVTRLLMSSISTTTKQSDQNQPIAVECEQLNQTKIYDKEQKMLQENELEYPGKIPEHVTDPEIYQSYKELYE